VRLSGRIHYNTGHFDLIVNPAGCAESAAVHVRETYMKLIVWLFRVLIFVLLLVLAVENRDLVTLHFYADYDWSAPLILIGLAFFIVGMLAGLLTAVAPILRLRMENGRLKRDLRVAREQPVVKEEPPMPPLI
jgi:lipopolysaccharide assembly protein A